MLCFCSVKLANVLVSHRLAISKGKWIKDEKNLWQSLLEPKKGAPVLQLTQAQDAKTPASTFPVRNTSLGEQIHPSILQNEPRGENYYIYHFPLQ
jgi:hypothetical protein